MTLRLRHVAVGLALHLAARFRRRFLRPDAPIFTLAEEIDYARFCAAIGKTPEDPVHARLMEDGPIDFFNVDPFYDMDLPRA